MEGGSNSVGIPEPADAHGMLDLSESRLGQNNSPFALNQPPLPNGTANPRSA